MAEVGTVSIALSLDDKRLVDGLNDAKKQTQKAAKSMSSNMLEIGKAAAKTALKIGSVATAAAGVVVAFKTIASVKLGAEMQQTADRLGITTKALSELTGVAKQFGIEGDQLADIMKDLSDKIADAANFGGSLEEAFVKMGLSSKQLYQLNMEQQFLTVADALGKMANKSDQVFTSMAIMADGGFKVLNMAKKGKEGIQAMRAEVAALGGALDDIDAMQLRDAQKAFNRIGLAVDAVFMQLAKEAAPIMEFVAEKVISLAKDFKKWRDNAFSYVRDVLGAWDWLVKKVQDFKIGLLGIGAIAFQIKNIFVKTWGLIAANFDVVIVGIKSGFRAMINGMILLVSELGFKTEKMLDSIATLTSYVDVDLGIQILKANSKLLSVSYELKEQANKGFENINADMTETTKAYAKAVVDLKDTLLGQDEETKKIRETLKSGIEDITSGQTGVEWIDQMKAEFEAQQELRAEQYNKELELQKEQNKKKIDLEKEKVNMMIMEANRQIDEILKANKKAEIMNTELWKRGYQGRLIVAEGFFGQMSQLMNTKSRELFEVGKAAAIAETTVNTYRAAQGAYASLAGIPIVGPALGIAAAGAAVAAGVANINAIRSAQMGGGGGGGAGGGGATAGGAAIGSSASGGQAAPAQEQAPQQTIVNTTLIGQNFSGEQVRALINDINEQTDDNTTLNATVSN